MSPFEGDGQGAGGRQVRGRQALPPVREQASGLYKRDPASGYKGAKESFTGAQGGTRPDAAEQTWGQAQVIAVHPVVGTWGSGAGGTPGAHQRWGVHAGKCPENQ